MTAGRDLRAARAQPWRDVAALLDPAGRCADPLATGRPLDWYAIYAVAAANWVAPTLYAELARSPQRWHAVPADVQQALAELHRLNESRNARLREALRRTVQCLAAAGIEALLLKGAIALLPGQYPNAGARIVGDLDIALQNADVERAAEVLMEAGYRVADDVDDPWFYDHLHHLPPLVDPSGQVCIELHREVLVPGASARALPLAVMRQDAQPFDWDGLRVWLPALPHRLLHNILHDAVQDGAYRSGYRSLRQLLELARLREEPGAAALDWAALLVHLEKLGLGAATTAQLEVSRQLFAQALPPGVHAGRAATGSAQRFWLWIERPGLWPYYKAARRVRQLARNACTPLWYPAKWRQLGRIWTAARKRDGGALGKLVG